ncbi:DUF6262 family protein [Pantanalinema sp. GBBB05]|uniref:DUF6262 family protein n=1 Tax=Pantanalinema sp. GBBB05 TaxID=2604139 RepID=UPI001D5321EF|nr:hypothetical protein [Pantanalinema sp. GBBB05]
MTVKRNVEGLRQNAQKKRQEALEKVEQGIRKLLKEGRAINFNTLASAAGVSKAFLYKEAEIKERVELLRSQEAHKKPQSKQSISDASTNAIVRTLRDRIKKLEAEIRDLRKQNEAAYGQIIEINSLRQQVGRLQIENDRLRQQVPKDDNRGLRQQEAAGIESEVRSLGIELNTTIHRLIQSAPPEIVTEAIKTLREAVAENRVENRAGFLNKAIRDAWKPNENQEEVQHELFNKWFAWAKERGLATASIQGDTEIMILTADEYWIPFSQAIREYPMPS